MGKDYYGKIEVPDKMDGICLPKKTFEETLRISLMFAKNNTGYNHGCKMFGGKCIGANDCPCLINIRGGYFGWGECIHKTEWNKEKED